MKEFRERRLFRNIFFSRAVFMIFLCASVLLAISVYGVYKKGRDAVSRNDIVKREVAEMEKRKDQLRANLNELQTESGVEKELRERFQIKKPGEDYVIILKDASTAQEAPEQKEDGFFKKVVDWFDIF